MSPSASRRLRIGIVGATLAVATLVASARPAAASCSPTMPLDRALELFTVGAGRVDGALVEDVRGFLLVEVVARAPKTFVGSDRHRGTAVRHWGQTDGVELTRSLDPGLVFPVSALQLSGGNCRGGGPVGSHRLLLVHGSGARAPSYPVDMGGDVTAAVARLDALEVGQREDPVTPLDVVPAWIAAWWPYVAAPVLLVAGPWAAWRRDREGCAGRRRREYAARLREVDRGAF